MKSKLYRLLLSSRPISWVNTAFPFAAVYIMTSHRFDLLLIVGTLYFLIPYNLLMYGINDVFDYESDIRNPRKGGIEGAKLDRTMHAYIIRSAIITSVPFVIALLALGDVIAGLVLLAVLFFVLAYSVPKLRFKERPFIDSVTSSLHFVGPAVYAFSLTEFSLIAIPILLSFFAWGIASHAFGAVQDIGADREGGLASIATFLGARRTVQFAIVLYLASAAILMLLGLPAVIIGVLLLLYVANILPYRNISDKACRAANKAWRRFIFINLTVGAAVTFVLITLYRH